MVAKMSRLGCKMICAAPVAPHKKSWSDCAAYNSLRRLASSQQLDESVFLAAVPQNDKIHISAIPTCESQMHTCGSDAASDNETMQSCFVDPTNEAFLLCQELSLDDNNVLQGCSILSSLILAEKSTPTFGAALCFLGLKRTLCVSIAVQWSWEGKRIPEE